MDWSKSSLKHEPCVMLWVDDHYLGAIDSMYSALYVLVDDLYQTSCAHEQKCCASAEGKVNGHGYDGQQKRHYFDVHGQC